MTRSLLIGTSVPEDMWLLDRSVPAMVQFTPTLPSMSSGGGPYAVWVSPTGEIVTSGLKFGTSTWYFYHFESGAWVEKSSVPGGPAVAIHGTSYNDVWAISSSGSHVLHWDGVSWTEDAVLSGSDPQDIFALDENNVYIAAGLNPSSAGLWFRRSGAYGSGVWTNEWADMGSDTGLGGSNGAQNVIAFDDDDIYFTIWVSTVVARVVHWNGFVWIASTNTADKAPMAATISGYNGEFWWRGYSGGYGASKIFRCDETLEIEDQGTFSNVYGGGDLVMFNNQVGYTIGEGPSESIHIMETMSGGRTWTKIIDHTPGGLVGTWMALSIWKDEFEPPVITPIDPTDGEIEVEKDSPVAFTITDTGSGVALSTVRVWIRGELAYDGENLLDGWEASTITAITDGYWFAMIPDRSQYHRADETTTVRVYAEDIDANSDEESWSFNSTRDFSQKIYPMLLGSIRDKDEGLD